jgi:2'-5' RNA ligase
MSDTPFIFLCIDLNIHVCEQLMLIQEQLGPIITEGGAAPQWIPPAHIHLTLKTLGAVGRGLVRPVQDTLRQALAAIPTFKITAKQIGAFPSGQSPRLLYAQVTQGEEPLMALREVVEAALEGLGVARDRKPFLPYVTLGRVLTPTQPIDLSGVLRALADLPLGSSEVRDVAIMQSHLTPKGAQHQVLSRAHLQRTAHPKARD